MADPICPEGMVLQKPNGAVFRDEPAFCIGKTEMTQEADNHFWAEKLKARFELLIKLVSGRTERLTDPQEAPLKAEAARQIARADVSGVEIRPVVAEAKPQPEGNMAGPRKPAVLRTWQEARDVCAGLYPGGDLPTQHQWMNACGSGEYCTASGNLNHTEVIYDANGPADVGSPSANLRGVQDMTGNVWEWTRDDVLSEAHRIYHVIRGGSWLYTFSYLRADEGVGYYPDYRSFDIGFRCVAPPQDSLSAGPAGKN